MYVGDEGEEKLEMLKKVLHLTHICIKKYKESLVKENLIPIGMRK